MKPLNPQLFKLLQLHFQTVLVSNDGCGSDLIRRPIRGRRQGPVERRDRQSQFR